MIELLTIFNSLRERLDRDPLSHEVFKTINKKKPILEFVNIQLKIHSCKKFNKFRIKYLINIVWFYNTRYEFLVGLLFKTKGANIKDAKLQWWCILHWCCTRRQWIERRKGGCTILDAASVYFLNQSFGIASFTLTHEMRIFKMKWMISGVSWRSVSISIIYESKYF